MRQRYRLLAALFITVLVMAALTGCRGAKTSAGPETGITESKIAETGAAKTKIAETGAAATKAAETKIAATKLAETGIAETEIAEDGTYTSKEQVALYLHTYGKLPPNYITKKQAEDLGWKKKEGRAGYLDTVAPGKSIGGSHFGNYEGQLPEEKGRKYYECDIGYEGGNRGAERIIYSNDGLIYYTGDHYKTFEELYSGE